MYTKIVDFNIGKLKDFKNLGDEQNRVCRFCPPNKKSTIFRTQNKGKTSDAHAIPKFLGNYRLYTWYECSDCNLYFGRTVESHLSVQKFFYISALGLWNKKYPTQVHKSRNGQTVINVAYEPNSRIANVFGIINGAHTAHMLRLDDDGKLAHTPLSETPLKFDKGCDGVACFKAYVKMALSIMPTEEFCSFQEAAKWTREETHTNFYSNDRKLLVRTLYYNGVCKYPRPIVSLYKRTDDSKTNFPYMLFQILWGQEMNLIEIPMHENMDCVELENLEYPIDGEIEKEYEKPKPEFYDYLQLC